MAFEGFSHKTCEFLCGIRENNNKQWYEENKKTFQSEVFVPLHELLHYMTAALLPIDPYIDTNPPKSAVSRINRDVRFTKDKSPYRSNMWLTVKRRTADWKLFPCFYVEIDEKSYTYGVGFYSMSPEAVLNLRQYIIEKPEMVRKAVAFASKPDGFQVFGDSYKRILNKTIPDDLLPWYQRKNIYVAKTKPITDIFFTEKLADQISEELSELKDFYNFLLKISS